ncbi:MAG: hypothetical protein DESF_01326 [Desulfovibrio sp.]
MKKQLSRRNFLKSGAAAAGVIAASGILARVDPVMAAVQGGNVREPLGNKSTVYLTKNLSAESLRAMYARVGNSLSGKTAVKLHTGEPNGPNIIPREWVKALLPDVPDPTIVECNVLYGSPRQSTESHRKTLETNGWTFAPVDIMDAEGDVNLPVKGGKWFKEVAFGKNIMNYYSMLVLTHFKGHAMGGFGGSLKNMSIGCASGKVGKKQLHSEGSQTWAMGPNFMERMVEGGKALTDHFGKRIVYINIMRNMSVDCDCDSSPEPVVTPDIGILASTDVLAIDQASVDMIYALPEAQRRHMVERIESREGLHQLSYMNTLGMGNAGYDFITI